MKSKVQAKYRIVAKPTIEEMREAVVEAWRKHMGGKGNWDEREHLHHLKNYAKDKEIEEAYEELDDKDK